MDGGQDEGVERGGFKKEAKKKRILGGKWKWRVGEIEKKKNLPGPVVVEMSATNPAEIGRDG